MTTSHTSLNAADVEKQLAQLQQAVDEGQRLAHEAMAKLKSAQHENARLQRRHDCHEVRDAQKRHLDTANISAVTIEEWLVALFVPRNGRASETQTKLYDTLKRVRPLPLPWQTVPLQCILYYINALAVRISSVVIICQRRTLRPEPRMLCVWHAMAGVGRVKREWQ